MNATALPDANACPDATTLKSLVDGTLSVQDSQLVTAHLDTCVSCQATIESVASGDLPVVTLVHGIDQDRPAKESAYWRAIESVQTAVRAGSTGGFESGPGEATSDPTKKTPPLNFLKPSDDPAYLGRLHHFEISRIIGRGGMGIVLEAFDTHLQRNVAVKVLNPEVAKNDVARQRFCREGRAAAAISHEHVVSMYQVAKESESDIAYLVMQLIEGDTLENRLESGQPMPPPEVARVGMQIAAGLSAAHARGMVHRDIKPANILIERETERVKLTDFGLARATDDVKLTKTGMVTGTPLYMSPEQATGGTADERSDMFSLGAVMYEMATGMSPFQAPTIIGVMKRIMDEMPEPAHVRNPLISRPLSDLIQTLLAKDPEERPESASDIARALASIVNEFGPISPLQVPAVASSEVRKLSGSHRQLRRRAVLGGWVVAAVVMVAALATGWWTLRQEPTLPSVALSGNPGTVWSVDFAPDGKTVVAAIEDGSIRVWDIQKRDVLKSFSAHRGIVWKAQFHPSRPLVATAGDDGLVKLWNARTYEPVREWRAANAVRGISFSPDGTRIVAGDREGVIHIYDLDSGEELVQRDQPGAIFGVDYSADGKLIATVGSDKTVRVWDAETLDERQTMSGHDGPIYDVAFAPQGSELATVGWKKNIRLWNVETGEEVKRLTGGNGDTWSVSFCGEGGHLVTGSQDGVARIWQLSDGKVVATLRGHDAVVHTISLDPKSRRIATGSRDGAIRVWDANGLEPKQ